jgi:hypothetical protein
MAVQAVAGMDAIAAAIAAGANPPADLKPPRFYRDGEVPENAELPYYLLGRVLEDPAGFYTRPGSSAAYRVHCWAETYTKALRLYDWLDGLLHNVTLTLDGHTVWQCKVRLVGSGVDASSDARQAEVEVEMESTSHSGT